MATVQQTAVDLYHCDVCCIACKQVRAVGLFCCCWDAGTQDNLHSKVISYNEIRKQLKHET